MSNTTFIPLIGLSSTTQQVYKNAFEEPTTIRPIAKDPAAEIITEAIQNGLHRSDQFKDYTPEQWKALTGWQWAGVYEKIFNRLKNKGQITGAKNIEAKEALARKTLREGETTVISQEPIDDDDKGLASDQGNTEDNSSTTIEDGVGGLSIGDGGADDDDDEEESNPPDDEENNPVIVPILDLQSAKLRDYMINNGTIHYSHKSQDELDKMDNWTWGNITPTQYKDQIIPADKTKITKARKNFHKKSRKNKPIEEQLGNLSLSSQQESSSEDRIDPIPADNPSQHESTEVSTEPPENEPEEEEVQQQQGNMFSRAYQNTRSAVVGSVNNVAKVADAYTPQIAKNVVGGAYNQVAKRMSTRSSTNTVEENKSSSSSSSSVKSIQRELPTFNDDDDDDNVNNPKQQPLVAIVEELKTNVPQQQQQQPIDNPNPPPGVIITPTPQKASTSKKQPKTPSRPPTRKTQLPPLESQNDIMNDMISLIYLHSCYVH
jgi:hypothetical protein